MSEISNFIILTDKKNSENDTSAHIITLLEILSNLDIDVSLISTEEIRTSLLDHTLFRKENKKATVVLNRLSSTNKNAFKVARNLSRLGWNIVDSPEKSWIAANKEKQYKTFKSENLPGVPTHVVSTPFDLKTFESRTKKQFGFGYPRVLKPTRGSSGRDVIKVDEKTQYLEGLFELFGKGFNKVLVQPFVGQPGNEQDLRVHVINNTPRLITRRKAQKGNWKTNLAEDALVSVEDITDHKEAVFLARKAAEITGLLWCCVDFLVGEDGKLYICELNPTPGIAKTVKQLGSGCMEPLVEEFIYHCKNR